MKSKKHSSKELKFYCRELSMMIGAGHSISYVLENISTTAGKNLSETSYLVRKKIGSGMSLSDSFSRTDRFTEFFVEMVRAGEVSGNLDRVFEELSIYYDKEHNLRSKLLNIMIYPTMLIFLSTVIFNFILVKIIPVFAESLDINGVELPTLTRIIIRYSRFLNENALIFFSSIILLVIAIIYKFKNSYSLKIRLQKARVRVPVLRDIYKLILSVKFSTTMSMLLSSGVGVLDAMDISSQALENTYIYSRIFMARKFIKRGNSVTNALNVTDIFPESFTNILKAGEISGMMDESFYSLRIYYEKELDIFFDKMIKLIEPIMIIVIGLVIGVGVISIVLPMFDAISSISY